MSNNQKRKTDNCLKMDPGYILHMQNAESQSNFISIIRMLPVLLFTAITITIVRLHIYHRPMSQFYWTDLSDDSPIPDLFSYNKMRFIIIVTIVAVIVAVVLMITKTMVIKRMSVYIPMAIYSLFVIVSYIGSDYKEFSLLGFNERFEGTIPLLCYMIMLFFTINAVNTKKDIRALLLCVGIIAALLGILGISQLTGHDFFNTLLGQKIITPYYTLADGTKSWASVENSFNAGELFYSFEYDHTIYQTIYNENYVSFYLTLLIPVFGVLFIRSLMPGSKEPIWKKGLLGLLFALLVFNMIGSKSSGGYFGLGIAVILAVILLNRYILKYWKPFLVFLVALGVVLGLTRNLWLTELQKTISYIKQRNTVSLAGDNADYASVRPNIDYIETEEFVDISINDNLMHIDYLVDDETIRLGVLDDEWNQLQLNFENDGYFSIIDDRFYPYMKLRLAMLTTDETVLEIATPENIRYPFREWRFYGSDSYYYVNDCGRLVKLGKIDHVGFDNNPMFGTGRGYIWSRTLPLLKNTIIAGYGADTFCAVFPQNDYAGKYNTQSWLFDGTIVIDKPHNMYLHAAVGTGVVSLIALLVLYGMYVVQSIRIFFNRNYNEGDYLSFVGFGLFCGLTAFMISGLVEDSTVSVMPMFYGLLGTGFAVNNMIYKQSTQSG